MTAPVAASTDNSASGTNGWTWSMAAVALGATALFGLTHGHAHGTELASSAAATYGIGLLFGTAALHGMGALVGRLGMSATRAASGALSAAGILLLAL